jgi:hypothetical protein
MPNATAHDPKHAILIAALHPQPDRFAVLLQHHGAGLDWPWLLERAAAHKVTPLLASRVAIEDSAALVPDGIRERLNAARAQAVERNNKALRDLERIDRCLCRAGIPYMLVKGPVLTQQVYDSPSQRHFFDLDLVLHDSEIDAAQLALEGLGYRLWGGDRYLGFLPPAPDDLARATRAMRKTLRRFGHELALVTDDRSLLPIDLHWQLMPRGRIRASALVWENVTMSQVGAVNVRVLDPEATVLHLAMHAWSNRPWSFALLHLCDVAWALHRLRVDPCRLVELADRWGGRRDLERTFYVLKHVLAIELPQVPRVGHGMANPSRRFRRIATRVALLENYAEPAPGRLPRLQQEIDWGLAMQTLSSTAILLWAKFTALMRYRCGR